MAINLFLLQCKLCECNGLLLQTIRFKFSKINKGKSDKIGKGSYISPSLGVSGGTKRDVFTIIRTSKNQKLKFLFKNEKS